MEKLHVKDYSIYTPVNVVKVRESGALEVVAGQMDSILSAIRYA